MGNLIAYYIITADRSNLDLTNRILKRKALLFIKVARFKIIISFSSFSQKGNVNSLSSRSLILWLNYEN